MGIDRLFLILWSDLLTWSSKVLFLKEVYPRVALRMIALRLSTINMPLSETMIVTMLRVCLCYGVKTIRTSVWMSTSTLLYQESRVDSGVFIVYRQSLQKL